MVNVQENKKNRIYSFEEVEKMVSDMDYIIIKDTFKFYSKKFTVKDSQGYYYLMNGEHIRDNKHPRQFGKENPYTIDNIKNYIKINNIKAKLLSDTYIKNNVSMLWQCECGKTFKRSWADFLQGFTICKDCAKHNRVEKRRIPLDRIYETVDKMGFKIVDDINNVSISSTPFSVIDKDNFLYLACWESLNHGKIPEKFHPCNPYAIHNINNFFKIELKDEFECIDKEYINNMKPLLFRHKKCGNQFYSIWADMYDLKRNPEMAYCKCSECNTQKTESHHASALKQVFIHEHPDTIVEDKSCINPKTSRVLPTDIVNHRLKIAIEIQSQWHDNKVEIDKFKKEFWISKGYNFYDPDIRNYSILEMIQIFFPEIDKTPDYVDYNFSNCIDFNKVQELLDKGHTIKEISSILNLNEHSVRHLSTIGKVKLPEDYKAKMFNIKAFVRLSKNGEFIKRYETLASLKEDNLAVGTIIRVLKNKQDFAYDSFWVYEDKYLSGDYVIPNIKEDIFMVPVAKYDMDNNYICSYENIYNAENDSASSRNEIRRVAKGDRKSSRNEKWIFL